MNDVREALYRITEATALATAITVDPSRGPQPQMERPVSQLELQNFYRTSGLPSLTLDLDAPKAPIEEYWNLPAGRQAEISAERVTSDISLLVEHDYIRIDGEAIRLNARAIEIHQAYNAAFHAEFRAYGDAMNRGMHEGINFDFGNTPKDIADRMIADPNYHPDTSYHPGTNIQSKALLNATASDESARLQRTREILDKAGYGKGKRTRRWWKIW